MDVRWVMGRDSFGRDGARGFTGAVGTCALAHYDVAGVVVDYNADAYEGA
jgi:hypothetical protein